MGKGHVAIFTGAVALAFGLALNFERGLAYAVGSGVALLAISWLVAGIIFLISWGRLSRGPFVIISVLVSGTVAYFSYQGSELDRRIAAEKSSRARTNYEPNWKFGMFADMQTATNNSDDSYWFSPTGCEFRVRFPNEPKIITSTVPGHGDVPEVQLSDARGLMRATCISPSGHGPNNPVLFFTDRNKLLDAVRSFAEQNGLSNVSYSHAEIPLGIRAAARGAKQIDGRWVTYEVIWLVSPSSMLGVTVAHLAADYPSPEISSFLRTISRNDAHKSDSLSSGFVTLRLPYSVRIDVPRTWRVLDKTMNDLIRTTRDAVIDLSELSTTGDGEKVLIAANSTPATTYAAIRVTRVDPPFASPSEFRLLDKNILNQMKGELENQLRKSLPHMGLEYLETKEIRAEEIGGWPAVVFTYRRSGPKGPVDVQLIQIARSSDVLRLNLSYRESERTLWMPVMAKIKSSLYGR